MLANNGKGTEKFIFEEIITTEYVVSIIHYSLFISLLGTSKLLSHDEFTT